MISFNEDWQKMIYDAVVELMELLIRSKQPQAVVELIRSKQPQNQFSLLVLRITDYRSFQWRIEGGSRPWTP